MLEPSGKQATREKPKRKNFRLYQSKVDRAKEVLGAETETEAVDRALDLVVFREELVRGVQAMKGAKLRDVLRDDEE